MTVIEYGLTISLCLYFLFGLYLGIRDINTIQIYKKKRTTFGRIAEFASTVFLLIVTGLSFVYPIEYVIRTRK